MDNWISEVIGKMHVHRITQKKLAEHLGWSNQYTSEILNGKRHPKGAKEKVEQGVSDLCKTTNQA